MRITTGKKTVRDLVHLTFQTVGGERRCANFVVFLRARCRISLLECWQSENGLQHRVHIAAKVKRRRVSPVREIAFQATYLFPRFFNPVNPGPQTGCSSFPSSPVMEKSNFRLCSICCQKPTISNTDALRSNASFDDSQAQSSTCPSSAYPRHSFRNAPNVAVTRDRSSSHHTYSSKYLRRLPV